MPSRQVDAVGKTGKNGVMILTLFGQAGSIDVVADKSGINPIVIGRLRDCIVCGREQKSFRH